MVSIAVEAVSKKYLERLGEWAAKVSKPGTSIGFKCVSPGFSRMEDMNHAYFRLLNTAQVVEKFIEAEKEGYDAVTVSCFFDPGIQAARNILKIPVVGPGESSMHLASQMGSKFGVVTIDIPNAIKLIQSEIKQYSMQDFAIPNPVRRFSVPLYDLFVTWMNEPKLCIPEITDKAEELVKEGAEVILNGCTASAPLATLANLVKVGNRDIPILDSLAVAIKTAELMVELQSNLGIPVTSRAGLTSRPSDEEIERVRKEFGLE